MDDNDMFGFDMSSLVNNANSDDIGNDIEPPIQEFQQPVNPQQQYTQPIQPEQIQQPIESVQQVIEPVQPVQQPVQPEQIQQPIESVQQVLEPVQPVVQPVQPEQIQQPTGPLDSITERFSPNVDNKKIIAEISPADYDNMVKILQVLNKESNSEYISIKQSNICQGQTDCIIEANIQQVLKNNKGEFVDLDIVNPKKYIKLLEQFRSQDNIYIVKDDDNKRFVITNGEVKLFLPIEDQTLVHQDAQKFDMSDVQLICQFEVDKDIRKIIKNLAKDQDNIEFLLQDNLVKAVYIPDTAIYTFPNFKNDTKAQSLDETNSELSLRCSNFLPVDADLYTIYIVKMKNEKYACIGDCKSGKISVRTTEICELATGGNILF